MTNGDVQYESMTAGAVRHGSKSLRVTIPELVVRILNIKDGTEIVWGFNTKTNELWVQSIGGKRIDRRG